MLDDRNDSMSALSNDDEFNVIHVPLLNEHKHSHSPRSTNNAKGRSTRNYPGTEIDDTGMGIRTMNDDYGVTVAETDTDNGPAYQVLKSKGLLVSKYRKDSFADIFLEMDLEPNSSLKDNFEKKMKWGVRTRKCTAFCKFRVQLLYSYILNTSLRKSTFNDSSNQVL